MTAIGFLLPPPSAVDRGSTVVHAAPLRTWWVEQHGFEMTYPEFTALCGVEGWGETSGPVTCKRCLRVLAARPAEETTRAAVAAPDTTQETQS